MFFPLVLMEIQTLSTQHFLGFEEFLRRFVFLPKAQVQTSVSTFECSHLKKQKNKFYLNSKVRLTALVCINNSNSFTPTSELQH